MHYPDDLPLDSKFWPPHTAAAFLRLFLRLAANLIERLILQTCDRGQVGREGEIESHTELRGCHWVVAGIGRRRSFRRGAPCLQIVVSKVLGDPGRRRPDGRWHVRRPPRLRLAGGTSMTFVQGSK